MLVFKPVLMSIAFHSEVNSLFLNCIYAWTDDCFRLSLLVHMVLQTNLPPACYISLPLVVQPFQVQTVPEAQAPAVWCDRAGRIFLQVH